MGTDTSGATAPPLRHLILLWFCGLYLRLTVLIAPPLAPRIAADLGLSQTGLGALTTIPVLMLALAALPAAWVIARLGPRATLVLALVVVALASAGRGAAPSGVVLYALTALMGAGIAAMQPALPALLQQWTPARIALGTAIYMNGMLLGEILSAGFTLPVILPLVGGHWELAFVAWSLPALAIAATLALMPAPGDSRSGTAQGWSPDWRHPLVWRLGLVLGATGALFFGTNAYMGSTLEARGEGQLLAIGLLLMNGGQVTAALVMLRFTTPWLGRPVPMTVAALLGAISLAGFLVLPGYAGLAAAAAVGLFSGIVLVLLVGLPPRYGGRANTAPLAAGMFTVGYTLSFLIPVAGGGVADLLGEPLLALAPTALYALAAVPVAWTLLQHDAAYRDA